MGVCVCVCFCCVRFTFFHTKPRDWLGETSPKGPTLCRGWDVKPELNQSSARLFDCVCVARSSSSGRPSHARDNGNAIKPWKLTKLIAYSCLCTENCAVPWIGWQKLSYCLVTHVLFRAFSVTGRTAWNSLPCDIRKITDTNTFKHHLKFLHF